MAPTPVDPAASVGDDIREDISVDGLGSLLEATA